MKPMVLWSIPMNEHSDQVELTRSQLYKRVWSEPMVRLVKELGIFGVPKADISGYKGVRSSFFHSWESEKSDSAEKASPTESVAVFSPSLNPNSFVVEVRHCLRAPGR